MNQCVNEHEQGGGVVPQVVVVTTSVVAVIDVGSEPMLVPLPAKGGV